MRPPLSRSSRGGKRGLGALRFVRTGTHSVHLAEAPRTRPSKQAWRLLAKTAKTPPSGLYIHKGACTPPATADMPALVKLPLCRSAWLCTLATSPLSLCLPVLQISRSRHPCFAPRAVPLIGAQVRCKRGSCRKRALPRVRLAAGPMVGGINCAVLGSSGEWNNGTFRQSPSPAVCSVANCDAKGPCAANRRRLGPHRKPAEYGTTRSTASTPHTLRPPPAASPVPILCQPPCMRRDLVGPLPSTKQPNRTHARTSSSPDAP
jgi:hypothetical protein